MGFHFRPHLEKGAKPRWLYHNRLLGVMANKLKEGGGGRQEARREEERWRAEPKPGFWGAASGEERTKVRVRQGFGAAFLAVPGEVGAGTSGQEAGEAEIREAARTELEGEAQQPREGRPGW